jgi:hypothetical protein
MNVESYELKTLVAYFQIFQHRVQIVIRENLQNETVGNQGKNLKLGKVLLNPLTIFSDHSHMYFLKIIKLSQIQSLTMHASTHQIHPISSKTI